MNVADRQTDRQTTYCGIIALCVASRGKNVCDSNVHKMVPKTISSNCTNT